jgi:dolichyl-phosphate-mannose--protein O-mannosyl transferase
VTAVGERPAAAPVTAPVTAAWRGRLAPATAGLSPTVGWLAALAVGLLAGVLRFLRLDLPAGRIFDEIYYSCDAQNLLRFGVEAKTLSDPDDPSVAERCEPDGEQSGFVVHPPLGKWAIALGIRLLGADELGWRSAAAVAGTLTVVVLVRLTRRMTGSTVLGCLAGLLLALDGLHFVQSRIAMLDVFLVLWTTAAAACLVADRDHVRARLARAPEEALAGWGPRLGLRPWLLAGGVCLGAALATKWSALYYVAALGLLALAWEVGARRTAGVAAPLRATLVRSTPALAGLLLVLPAVLYVLSWAGWFAGDLGWSRSWAAQDPASGVASLVPEGLRSLWHYHEEMYRFHDQLSARHPYQSHPAGWLVLARPVSYYYPQDITAGDYGCTAASCAREVLAIGTPALWWAATAALFGLLWMWAARRDWRAGTALLLVATGIVPWVRDDLDGRTMFLFYALPAVPFLCLGVVLVAGHLVGGPTASARRRRLALAGTGLHLALVVTNFAFLYPVLAAQTLPIDAWRDRMWFSSWI